MMNYSTGEHRESANRKATGEPKILIHPIASIKTSEETYGCFSFFNESLIIGSLRKVLCSPVAYWG